ncbi:isochorismatase family protein [Arthrobacter echini]|uniref:Isochorismatase family protein n=1 Tax=Arthrobacter echini TaxID=1529066 RepID=A0A4S5E1D8_9MICC|nr:isochorismatase family protein [Arthrobacter echini]THJ65165.1 isochorismatase family protein [Arthrobacter echini]
MAKTQPEPVRDPASDNLLAPENCVIALIDYQDTQFGSVTTSSRERLLLNIRVLCEASTRWDVPVVVSTVGVGLGANEGTVEEIMARLPEGTKEIDRTGDNAWEDPDFRAAVEATGRRKVVIGGLWTEVCVTFPTLDMRREGYEVYPVADAIAGVSPEAHSNALERMRQAGATPITALQFASELMRNWARPSANNLREIMGWYFPEKSELDASESGGVRR